MTQGFIDNCFARGNIAATDMANMERNFAALKSSFSGVSAPANAAAFQFWGDTVKKCLKHRSSDETVWHGTLHGDVSQKIWVYRNAAMDGWAVVTGVTDKVVAIKGGSLAYDTTGGTTAGTWNVPLAHIHKWYCSYQPIGADRVYDSNGDEVLAGTVVGMGGGGLVAYLSTLPGSDTRDTLSDAWTSEPADTADWHLAAAVGTLQYLDLDYGGEPDPADVIFEDEDVIFEDGT